MILIPLRIITPEKVDFSLEVSQVVLPASQGQAVILPNHAPMVISLSSGVLSFLDAQNKETRVYIEGGVVEVEVDGVNVLTNLLIAFDTLDLEALTLDVVNAQQALARADTEDSRKHAQKKVERTKNLISALGRRVVSVDAHSR